MSFPDGYEVTKVKSNQTLNYDNFTGDITFSFVNEAEKWTSPKITFMTVQLRITNVNYLYHINPLKIVDVDVVSNKPGAAILTDYYGANSNNIVIQTMQPLQHQTHGLELLH